MVQRPSNALLLELGQASFAVALVGLALARALPPQAHPFQGDGCLTDCDNTCHIKSKAAERVQSAILLQQRKTGKEGGGTAFLPIALK
jgi:hypothetical protein